MKSGIFKQCVICKENFQPDKRTEKRQKVCSKLSCKVEYKRSYNKQWRHHPENIDYFKGRYSYLQQWLENHPDYLRKYRLRKNNDIKQKPDDIQVELTPNNNNVLILIKLINDIQVELNANINRKKDQLTQPLLVDIQV